MKILTLNALLLYCLVAPASLFAVNMRTPFVSVFASGVVPGEAYSLKAHGLRTLKIYNKGAEKITVKFEASPVGDGKNDGRGKMDGKTESHEPIPDVNWISFEKESLDIAPGAFAETDVLINVPDEKKYYGRKFAAVIVSAGSAGGNLSAGLRSKLFFETLKRKSFFGRLFGSVGSAFRPR